MRRRKGFTLIEMMIVILVIAVLATLVGVSVRNARERSRQATLTAQLNIMHNAIMYYQNDMSAWPPDLNALTSTTTSDPNYHGPYLERVPPHPYHGTWTYDSSIGRVTP